MPCVEVDESLPPVQIPGQILSQLFAHAREALPEECCGLIVGTPVERFRRLERCHNDMTLRHREDPESFPRDGTAAYWMRPADYRAWLLEPGPEGAAEEVRERVTAVYHSHVGTRAHLSEMDLEYAQDRHFPFPDAGQIVVAVPSPDAEHVSAHVIDGRVVGVGIFLRHGPGGAFRGHPVAAGAP
jgi:proteasome lid subunit RPN8/RPN11